MPYSDNIDKNKIGFIGLYNEKNLGDPIIFDCTEWLYKRYMPSDSFISRRLYLDYIQKTYSSSLSRRIKNRLIRMLYKKKTFSCDEKIIFEKTKEYFENEIKNYDLLVVVGGGIIKWSYQFFYLELVALLLTAEKMNVPVVFNAVGVEGYSEDSVKCQQLKEVMQLPALIHVSTRDDLETLVNKYYDGMPQRPVLRVADPAVWVSEAYGIRKKKSRIVGIGIARGNLFIDNAINFTNSELLALYKGLIVKLLEDGCQIEIFTNGLPADNDFANQVQETLKKDGYNVGKRYPQDTIELVDMISCYRAIIATRLHSCIIAYSLDVPAVGLVWNDKLSLFGRNIQAEDNFIKYYNFNVDCIVAQLYKAIKTGYDQEVKDLFRQTIIQDIIEVGNKTISMERHEHIMLGGGRYDLFVY